MAEMNDALSKLADIARDFSTQPLIKVPDYSFVNNIVPQIPTVEIDEESTFAYQMQQQTNQIIEKSNEQIKLLNEHNEQLISNYKKLEDLYKLKEKELEEAKQEAKKSKRYNTIMMIISVVSMMIAAAAWLLPNILGGVS
jgi:molecular chaperone GrpE (heat shock protein)